MSIRAGARIATYASDAISRDSPPTVPQRLRARPAPYDLGDFTSASGEAAHAASIRRVRDAIVDGDLFQANITQRIEASFGGDPLDVFVRGWRGLEPDFAAYVGWPAGRVLPLPSGTGTNHRALR